MISDNENIYRVASIWSFEYTKYTQMSSTNTKK